MLFATPVLQRLSCLWIVAIIFGICAARSFWSDKPWINVNSSEISEGEWVNVLCGVPIDYTGGFCRLHRDEFLFKTQQTNSYVCEFYVSSHELLAGRRTGTKATLRCDYTLQNYVSVPSDSKTVVVWGSAEQPVLKMSPQVVMLGGSIQVDCKAPRYESSECSLHRGLYYLDTIPCSHQIKVEKLMRWKEISLFNKITIKCKYRREGLEYVESDPSDPKKILVLDPSKLQISSNQRNATFVCDVPTRVRDFVLLHTGNTTLSLEMGGKLILEATNNSTGLFNLTCQSI